MRQYPGSFSSSYSSVSSNLEKFRAAEVRCGMMGEDVTEGGAESSPMGEVVPRSPSQDATFGIVNSTTS